MARRCKAFTASVVAALMAAVFMAGNFAYIQPVRAASLEGVTQADPGPVPDGLLRVHYQRADQQYGHMGLWLWGDVKTPSEQAGSWPGGAAAFDGNQTTSYGAYLDIPLKDNAAHLNFIVVDKTSGVKEGGDKYVALTASGPREVWIKEGSDEVSLQEPSGPPTGGPEDSQANFPAWSQDSVIYEVNVRQFTKEGTFAAFEAHLPRLKELGAEILWLMPIHPISQERRVGTLGSYYSVADYKAVNPEFGTMDDFKRLVDKAHDMGFKVMLDWVANHTGWDHPWIQNKSWYVTDAGGNIVAPEGWSDAAELNYDNPDMRAAMIDAMVYWVREADIDGYRADFASGVPQDFWETARRELDQIKPVYMLAEDDTQIGLLRQAFNSNYNMGLFYNIMKQIPGGGVSAANVKAFLDAQAQKYPKGAYPMNYITNHDTNSWEGTASEMFGEAESLMAALSFTVPGIPLIYSGQEAGLNKRLQFFEKDEIDWSGLSKQDFYKRLIQTKRENPALWNGNAGGPVKYLAADDGQVLAFEREKDGNKVIVILNLSGTARTAAVQAGASAGRYYDVFGQSYTNIGAGQTFTLAPWGYRIFAKSE